MSCAMINIYNMCMCTDTHDTSSIVLNDKALVVELLDGRIFRLLINLIFSSMEIFIHPQISFWIFSFHALLCTDKNNYFSVFLWELPFLPLPSFPALSLHDFQSLSGSLLLAGLSPRPVIVVTSRRWTEQSKEKSRHLFFWSVCQVGRCQLHPSKDHSPISGFLLTLASSTFSFLCRLWLKAGDGFQQGSCWAWIHLSLVVGVCDGGNRYAPP